MNCTLGGSFSLLLVRGSLPSFAPSFVLSLRRLLGICAWGSELLPQGPFPAGASTLPRICALPLFPLTFPKDLFFSWLLQKLNCASLLWETASSVPWCIPGEGLHFPEPTVPVGSTCQQGTHAIGTPPWGPASPQCQWGAHAIGTPSWGWVARVVPGLFLSPGRESTGCSPSWVATRLCPPFPVEVPSFGLWRRF